MHLEYLWQGREWRYGEERSGKVLFRFELLSRQEHSELESWESLDLLHRERVCKSISLHYLSLLSKQAYLARGQRPARALPRLHILVPQDYLQISSVEITTCFSQQNFAAVPTALQDLAFPQRTALCKGLRATTVGDGKHPGLIALWLTRDNFSVTTQQAHLQGTQWNMQNSKSLHVGKPIICFLSGIYNAVHEMQMPFISQRSCLLP